MNLQNIGVQGFAGLAPTPVQSYVIQNYLKNSELLNALKWCNTGLGTSLGNFITSVVVSDGSVEAVGRALGTEYVADNEPLRTEQYVLKMLGGSILSDVEIQRAFKSTVQSVASNYTQVQIEERIRAIEKCFCKWFITGDSATDAKQWDGLEKFLSKSENAGQVISSVVDVSGMNEQKAFLADVALNTCASKLAYDVTFILTTRKGASLLTSLNQYQHRNTEAIEFNNAKYNQYNGLPIVKCDDTCFKAADLSGKIPLYMIYSDEMAGVRVAIPNDGQIMTILLPEFDNGTGNVTAKGTVEMMCVPIFERLAVAKTYISDTPSASEP